MPRTVHLLALVAAFLSAGATIFIRQGLRNNTPYTGFWINLVVGTIGLWVGVLAMGGVGRVSAAGLGLFALAGLIGTVGGRLLRFVSIETVGASISAALTNLNPLFASGLAILVLGERVTAPIVSGTAVIVLGTILLSATCFGVVAILRKLGLSHMSAITGSAVNVTTALVAYTAFLLASGRGDTMACRGRSLGHFVAAGIAENAGVFLNVVALGLGTVSIVAPLYGSSPIFVLLLSFFFLKGLDLLSGRIVAGTLLIVAGVYLITALSGH